MMKAGIYARYSSENQSDKSIDDQVRVCKKYAAENGITIDDRHIFIDEAKSGSLVQRPGLQAIEQAVECKEIETVLVDDLSRLSRSNHQMLTLVLKFHFHQVRIISIADGINTDDENSKVGIQLRGLVNELYLDDLRKKTSRGLEGQKLRGFSTGEKVYGYSTHPVGEMKLNRKGQAKYDGMLHKINIEEAEVVKRIFTEFSSGKSGVKIAAGLNADKIPTKFQRRAGWNKSTLCRILHNPKYVGIWDWRKTKTVRDPMTGRKKAVIRPDKDIIPIIREDLRIIDKELWVKTQKRLEDVKGTWPVSKKRKQFYQQKSFIHTSPIYLFSGLMKCHICGGAIILISGKGSGYYGCSNYKTKSCTNTLKIPRKRLEEIIISKVKEKVLTPDNLFQIYKRVEELAAKEMNTVPDQIKKKQANLDKTRQEVDNYMNFIKIGNISKSVSDAISDAEKRLEQLKAEIESFKYQIEQNFKAPPKEWIKYRIDRLTDTLNRNTVASGLALKALLGSVTLEPILSKENDFYKLFMGQDKDFKPFYVAHTEIATLALLDEEHAGASWYHWRRVQDSNLHVLTDDGFQVRCLTN